METRNTDRDREGSVSRLLQLRVSDWLEQGDGVVTCYRQYLRVRRPAIFTRAWPAATLRAPNHALGLVFPGFQGQPFDHSRTHTDHRLPRSAPTRFYTTPLYDRLIAFLFRSTPS